MDKREVDLSEVLGLDCWFHRWRIIAGIRVRKHRQYGRRWRKRREHFRERSCERPSGSCHSFELEVDTGQDHV